MTAADPTSKCKEQKYNARFPALLSLKRMGKITEQCPTFIKRLNSKLLYCCFFFFSMQTLISVFRYILLIILTKQTYIPLSQHSSQLYLVTSSWKPKICISPLRPILSQSMKTNNLGQRQIKKCVHRWTVLICSAVSLIRTEMQNSSFLGTLTASKEQRLHEKVHRECNITFLRCHNTDSKEPT